MKNLIKKTFLSLSLMLFLGYQQVASTTMFRKTATGTALFLATRFAPRVSQHPLYKHTQQSFSSDVSLSTFRIGFTDNQYLYANDNQQLAVTVTVQKEVDYDYAPLTDAEKASITIAERSNNMQAGMPQGWSCDKEPNEYNQGLVPSLPMALDQTTENPNQVKRYLRTNKVDSQQLMATITLDNGTTHSTNQNEFDSYISLTPTVPYRITAHQLTLNKQEGYAWNGDSAQYIHVDVYYWMLPSGLEVKEETFSGQLDTSTNKLLFCFDMKLYDKIKKGAIIKKDITQLTIGDIDPTSSHASEPIQLINDPSYMRAMYYRSNTNPPYTTSFPHHAIQWTLTDSFGCVQPFHLQVDHLESPNGLALTDS